MKKSCFWFLLAGFCLFFFTPAKATAQERQTQIVTCESHHNKFQSCSIRDLRSEVVLVEEFGHARCIRGQSWGNDSNGVWVDKGCRAKFQVNIRPENEPAWWNSGHGRNHHERSGNGACFFKNVNFTGDYFCSEQGSNIPQVKLDDEITSIQIYGQANVTIYKDPNFSGPEATTGQSIPDLHRWRMPNNPNLNWDNRISSARIN
jgi:hypothetical protein